MLNTKLGFFYVHRFARLIYEVTRFIYETYGCLFPHYICSTGSIRCLDLAIFGKQTAVRVFVNLPVTAKSKHRIMNKEVTLGTPAVPAHETDFVTKLRDQLNHVLPQECQIKTAQDAWYAGAVFATIVTFIFPPALLALAYCVVQAKKEGGER